MSSIYDVQQICRTCMNKADELIALDSASDECVEFESMSERQTNGDLLMAFAKVDFRVNDGLPPNICVDCVGALNAAFAYRQQCEQSDTKLRRMLQQHLNSVHVKVEKIEEHEVLDATLNNSTEPDDVLKPEISVPMNDKNEDEDDGHGSNDNGDDGNEWTTPVEDDDDSESNESTHSDQLPMDADQTKWKLFLNSQAEVKRHADDVVNNAKYENGRLKCELCNVSFLNTRTLRNHLERQGHVNRYNRLHGAAVVKVRRRPVKKIKTKKAIGGGTPSMDEDAKIADRAQCINGRYICQYCSNSFAERISLKFHIRIHLGINLHPCPQCERAFSRVSYLQQHVRTNHSKNSPCPKCDSVFDNYQALRAHTNAVHKEVKPKKMYACEICSRTFNRTHNLKEHRLTHSRERNFQCDICKKKYSTKRGVKDHMRSHGDRANFYPHLCVHCGKKFATTSHMAKHIRTKHTVNEYKCENCEKVFQCQSALKMHMQKHLNRFICKVCGKSLSTKFRLMSHTRMHTGEKPFVCGVCTQAFSQAKSLKLHLRSHGDEAPYRCNVCHDVFTHSRWLEIHRRQFDHQLSTNEKIKTEADGSCTT